MNIIVKKTKKGREECFTIMHFINEIERMLLLLYI